MVSKGMDMGLLRTQKFRRDKEAEDGNLGNFD